jgi:hypothetical protein
LRQRKSRTPLCLVLRSSQKAKEGRQTMKFTLEIELGNDVMQTGPDLAAALAKTAEFLRARDTDKGYLLVEDRDAYDRQHSVTDEHGCKVGSWKLLADLPFSANADLRLLPFVERMGKTSAQVPSTALRATWRDYEHSRYSVKIIPGSRDAEGVSMPSEWYS